MLVCILSSRIIMVFTHVRTLSCSQRAGQMFKSATAIFLSLSILFALSVAPVAAQNGFTYSPPVDGNSGKFEGDLPLDRMGKMALPRGLASFSQDELIIQAVPQWLFDRNVVFRGPIIRAEAVPQKSAYVLGGLALMLDGLWAGTLLGKGDESIDTVDGAVVRGNILGRTADTLQVKAADGGIKNVAFSNIRSIRSPRAFNFRIESDGVKINPADSNVTFVARSVVITPVAANAKSLARRANIPRSTLAGTEPGISKTALTAFVALDIVNMITPPIVIPLVINYRNQKAAKSAIAKTEFTTFVNSLQSSAPATQTASTSSGSGP